MTAPADESGPLPALDDDDAIEDARERAHAAIVNADVLDLADEAMTRVSEIVTALGEELEAERACTRMLRAEVAKLQVRNAELEAMLARKEARLAKTA